MVQGYSIIIPVFNEEDIISDNTIKLIKFLNKLKKPYEIILANNGSTDKTLEKAKYLSNQFENVKYVTLKAKAPGLAFKKATSLSSYENIISQDKTCVYYVTSSNSLSSRKSTSGCECIRLTYCINCCVEDSSYWHCNA